MYFLNGKVESFERKWEKIMWTLVLFFCWFGKKLKE